MKLLVIGSGGREHALAWRLSQGAGVEKVFVAPGNAGTALTDKLENVALSGNEELIEFVKKEGVAFTVVVPEAPSRTSTRLNSSHTVISYAVFFL